MDRLLPDYEPSPPGVDLSTSLGMLRRRSKVIIGCLLLGLAAGAAYSALAPKRFQATSTVALRNISAAPFGGADQQSGAAVDNQTEQLVASSLVVAQLAQRQLNSATSPALLLSNLTVTAPAKTAILIFSYTGASARSAARGADAFASSYLRYSTDQARAVQTQAIAALGSRLADLNQQVAKLEATLLAAPHGSAQAGQAQALLSLQNAELNSLRNAIATDQALVLDPGKVVAAAVLPTTASSPKTALGLGAGALVGLVIGLLAAAVRDRRDDRLRRRGPLDLQCAPLPVLLEMASRPGSPDPRQLPAPGSALEEAVGEMCSRLVLAGLSDGGQLAVAAVPGTATEHNTALMVAAGLARTGSTTVLVRTEADRQEAGHRTGPGESPQTAADLDALGSGAATVESVLHPFTGCDRLLVMDLAGLAGAPEAVAAALTGLRRRGYLVVAAAGAADRAATARLSAGADAVLLVATAARSTTRDLQACRESLEVAELPAVGVVVLNRRRTHIGARPAAVFTARSRGQQPAAGDHSSNGLAHRPDQLSAAEA